MADCLHFLNELDTSLLIGINSAHTRFWDFIMYWLSNRPIWIPLYAFLIYCIFKWYGKNGWYIMLGVALMILVSDQASVHLFKNQFQRLRPCHEPDLQGVLHLVNGVCGGQYGFISSHATNTFNLAVFLFGFFLLHSRTLAWFMLAWAAAVSFSRIYLGVHYPGDVLAGILVGSAIGYGFRIMVTRWLNSRMPAR